MDANEIAKEISEKVGEVVKVTVKVRTKHQKLDALKILMAGHENQAELYHKMLINALKNSDNDCLSLDELEKLNKSMLEFIENVNEKMKKQFEEEV